jgi:hypothetical protein
MVAKYVVHKDDTMPDPARVDKRTIKPPKIGEFRPISGTRLLNGTKVLLWDERTGTMRVGRWHRMLGRDGRDGGFGWSAYDKKGNEILNHDENATHWAEIHPAE